MSTPRTTAAPSWASLVMSSLWLLPVLFGRGGFAWIGFLIIAVMTRRAALFAAAGVWAIVGLLLVADWGQWQGILVMVAWVGSIIHALIVQQGYLRAQAAAGATGGDASAHAGRSSNASTDSRTSTARSSGSRSSRSGRSRSRRGSRSSASPSPGGSAADADRLTADAAAARSELIAGEPAARSRPEAPAAPDPADRVDVNTASRRRLAGLPGMTSARARTAIAEREQRGGFSDLDEFAAALNLQPHEFARLRPAALCSPRARPRSYGRRLDL